jgi:hypothetical protein
MIGRHILGKTSLLHPSGLGDLYPMQRRQISHGCELPASSTRSDTGSIQMEDGVGMDIQWSPVSEAIRLSYCSADEAELIFVDFNLLCPYRPEGQRGRETKDLAFYNSAFSCSYHITVQTFC